MMKAFLLAAGAVILSGVASATTITVNCSVVSGPTEIDAQIACPQFDPAAGTLNSVMVTVLGEASGTITLFNGAATTQLAGASASTEFHVDALPGFSFVNPLFITSFDTGGKQSYAPGQSRTYSLAGSGSETTGTATTDLGSYIGLGDFQIHVTTVSNLTISGGGGQVQVRQDTMAKATAQVTYDYGVSEVPEPSTMVLLGAGLLVVARKRIGNR